MGTWWPRRRVVAVAAILAAALTATWVAALSGSVSHLRLSVLYTIVSALGVAYPPAIVVQVIAGQGLAASMLLAPEAPAPFLLIPVVVGVVATAELLALSARLGSPVERAPWPDVGRTLAAMAISAAMFTTVLFAGELPGPSGVVAVILASAALVGSAAVLVGRKNW